LPCGSPPNVAVLPVPVIVMLAGRHVSVHVPDDGNPLSATEPDGDEQEGCVMVTINGVARISIGAAVPLPAALWHPLTV
jgi:hypothetical protein